MHELYMNNLNIYILLLDLNYFILCWLNIPTGFRHDSSVHFILKNLFFSLFGNLIKMQYIYWLHEKNNIKIIIINISNN